jgi:hypothetical protein
MSSIMKNQMQVRPKFILMFAIAFGIWLWAMLILPTLVSSGKLYGNQRALVWIRLQMHDWRNADTNNPTFDFYKLPAKQQKQIVELGFSLNLWLKTCFTWEVSSNREIVIVSAKQYDNAYAVGYSDGATGLISAGQFTNLNLTGFVSLSNLATNSEFSISKP